MVRTFQIALLALLLNTSSLFAVTASGTVLLQDQQNHSGSRIIFTSSSPSAQTDTAYSEVSGFYSLDLAIGIYDIEYSHEGFVPVTWNDVAILSIHTLDSVSLIANANTLTGNISGTLAADTFYIVGDLYVPVDSTLELLPGTTFLFTGNYRFFVHGQLLAIGTEQDSIRFSSVSADSNNGRGISISASSDTSRMEYCTIENSMDGAINVSGNLECHHLRIENNHVAVICQSASWLNVEHCIFRNNISNLAAAIHFAYSIGSVSECVFEGNTSINEYGVIFAGTSEVTIDSCLFADNDAKGVVQYSSSNVVITRSLFHGNLGAISSYTSHLDVTNCTIDGNQGTAIVLECTQATVSSTIITNSTGYGFYFQDCDYYSSEYEVSYCDIFGNELGSVEGIEYAPQYLCQPITTNSNGDSADVYLNIFEDPMFFDAENGYYDLWSISHLINAGDPDLPLDPDGTIADIGAYYFDLGTGIDPRDHPVPQSYVSLSNYPNPFNPVTHLNFDLSETGTVSLDIYDLSGRIVGTLVNKSVMTEGSHEFTWNAESLPSGSYFAKLVTPNQTAIHRIILLK